MSLALIKRAAFSREVFGACHRNMKQQPSHKGHYLPFGENSLKESSNTPPFSLLFGMAVRILSLLVSCDSS